TGAYLEGNGREFFNKIYGGDMKKLTLKIALDLNDWGFNTVGYHYLSELSNYFPFMQDSYTARISYWMGQPIYPDVFDPFYKKKVEENLEQLFKKVRHNPNLIGYYWTDTPRWDLEKARNQCNNDWVSTIRSLPASAPGKEKYVEFLFKTIKDPSEFEYYKEGKAPSYKKLLKSNFSNLDYTHPLIEQHDRKFLRIIAHQYYSLAFEATKKVDSNHLIFGDRYLSGDHPIEVLEEALPYVDVISVQPYTIKFDREYFDHLYKRTRKPILICDHAINFPTEEHSKTVWPQSKDESSAAHAYSEYLLDLFRCPYILGYHRCQYIDRKESKNSLLKQGFLRVDENPYDVLVKQISNSNYNILALFDRKEN
ncbi:MAG: hypothetical protein ACFFD7_03425, partial [Candidatus Thorarchaeota archaeon]